MNVLQSYDDIKNPFNQRLHSLLPNTRSIVIEKELHFDSQHPQLNPSPLILSSQSYPYTPLGTLGLVDPSSKPRIITPYLNRYADSSQPNNAGQLILLDTDTQQSISDALKRDAKFTLPKERSASEIFLNEHQPNAEWLLENWSETKKHINGLINRQDWSASVNQHLFELRNYKLAHFEKLRIAAWYDEPVPAFLHTRTLSNGTKSAGRLINHYRGLDGDLSQKGNRTEARGDYAAAKLFLTVMGPDFQMKMGKSSSNSRPNGIDQIWVRRDLRTGDVLAYYIVESKGSTGAHLGFTSTGEQMSSQWLFNCLIKMNAGKLTHTDPTIKKQLSEKILTAMINGTLPVKGVIFHSLYGSQGFTKIIRMTELRDYNCPEIFLAASVSSSLFSNASNHIGFNNISGY